MHWAYYMITIFLFSFTGWLTTWFLIKLLFHPRKQVNVLGMQVQGILPKNQQAIAERLGRLVSSEFSFSGIQEKITDPHNLEKLKPEIEKHIDLFLREKLKDSFPMLSMFIGDKTINQLKGAFLMELETLFPILMKNYIGNLEQDLDLQKTVTDKVAGFSMEKLEDMLTRSTKKQFIYLQLMSAFVGLIIGLVYVFVSIQLQ
ncbi:MAG TPA: hypothetical protein VK489_01175 [Ferruginibacter sp.]|nr:hypothetical protein [Ferruginibacter sp.]